MYTEGKSHVKCCQSKLRLDYSMPGHNERKSTKLREQKNKTPTNQEG